MAINSRLIIILSLGVILLISLFFNFYQSHIDLEDVPVNSAPGAMFSIKYSGNNISQRIDTLLNKIEEMNLDENSSNLTEEDYDELNNLWRIIAGESHSMGFYIGNLPNRHPELSESMENKLNDLQYILLELNKTIDIYKSRSIEQSDEEFYSFEKEDIERLEAISVAFKKIYQGVDANSAELEIKPDLIDSLTEPMMIVDDNYSEFIERKKTG